MEEAARFARPRDGSCHYYQVNLFTGLGDKTFVSYSRDETLKFLDICTEKCIKHSLGIFVLCMAQKRSKMEYLLLVTDIKSKIQLPGFGILSVVLVWEITLDRLKLWCQWYFVCGRIFVTVSSDVIENVCILQKGRHVHSFSGRSTYGSMYDSRFNYKISTATKNKSVMFVCNIKIFFHLNTIS